MGLNKYYTPWKSFVSAYSRENTIDENTLLASFVEDEYKISKLPESGVAIDLGMHIGSVSLALASRGWRVIGVEMLPENVKAARDNISLNGFDDRIKIYQRAIFHTDGQMVEAYYSDVPAHKYNGTILPQKGDTNKIGVETITLETIFKENKIDRCDFLKVDIEGTEWDIFKNTPKEVMDKIDRIAVEIEAIHNDSTNTQEFLEIINEDFIDVSNAYFGEWSKPGSLVHGYYIRKGLTI
jgi:FkbM family methyltransferase